MKSASSQVSLGGRCFLWGAVLGGGAALVEASLAYGWPAAGIVSRPLETLVAVFGSAVAGLACAWVAGLFRFLDPIKLGVGLLGVLLSSGPVVLAGHSGLWSLGMGLMLYGVMGWSPNLGRSMLLSLPILGFLQLDRGGAGPGGGPVSASKGPDILLITVDALRADAIPALPEPDAWLRFDQAVSPAPWTLPSFISLFTGLAVAVHGGGLPFGPERERYTRPTEGLAWLPQLIHDGGYATTAWVCNPYLGRSMGMDRGFQRFVHSDDFREPHLLVHAFFQWRFRLLQEVQRVRHTRDERLVDGVLGTLAAPAPGPRFVWVHLLSPHEYSRDPASPVQGFRPGTDDPEVLKRVYAENVRVTTAQVERLMEGVDLSQTLVAITSDHGEALGEPGYMGHGRGLSDPELRVPLLLRGPGVQGGIVTAQVATMDLGATLLALAGIPGHFPGRDLRAGSRERVPVGGLRKGAPRFAERLEGGIWVEAQGLGAPLDPGAPMSPADLEALEALGYLDTDPPRAP